jgi:hypothetical protein
MSAENASEKNHEQINGKSGRPSRDHGSGKSCRGRNRPEKYRGQWTTYHQTLKTRRLALGLTTFPALLGSSTGVDKTAAGDFYLRITQILFPGLFTIYALMIVEHLLRPRFLETVNNLLQVMF